MNQLEAIVQELKEAKDPASRLDVVCRIGTSGIPGAAKVLVQAYTKEKDPMVREAIICSLLIGDSQEVVREMACLLKSQQADERSLAVEVLTQKLDDKVSNVIEVLLKDPDRDVRVMTVHILGRSRCPESLSLLRKVIAEDEDINVVGAAMEYIGEMGSTEDVQLIEGCARRFTHPYIHFIVQRATTRLCGEPTEAAS
ncbi:HEAT repeat-containing protein [Thermanaeromonas toyohensis ToBE]|uniref:HEAT repeat-containing protein n=1 Tax=Thermanaeromonas toyohensis ToBE TaxID=698762 RepID=A0A1W1VWW7_9FIRM|nr:HEAT repeat domain-containing protein [Thermanaeromonas toyohensis]SMB97845.1 HEAT repeat-containing protein [Thermanaeromonas toyohensis ToBE]